jgi:predicted nucleic acid-binding protein
VNLFLDACAIIYRIEAVAPFDRRFTGFIEQLATEGKYGPLIISRLSFLECRIKPLRDADQELLARYDGFFRAKDLLVVELTKEVVEQATRLRARHGLRTPDALQAACCLTHGQDTPFITADAAFRRVEGLDVRLLMP